MGYDIEMEEYHNEKKIEKEMEEALKKELEELQNEIIEEAKKVVDDYVENPSELSGSVVNIHQNSPYLDVNENGEPRHKGNRWKRALKGSVADAVDFISKTKKNNKKA